MWKWQMDPNRWAKKEKMANERAKTFAPQRPKREQIPITPLHSVQHSFALGQKLLLNTFWHSFSLRSKQVIRTKFFYPFTLAKLFIFPFELPWFKTFCIFFFPALNDIVWVEDSIH